VSPFAPFHWFNRYAYLKLGVLASCQLVFMSTVLQKHLNAKRKDMQSFSIFYNSKVLITIDHVKQVKATFNTIRSKYRYNNDLLLTL